MISVFLKSIIRLDQDPVSGRDQIIQREILVNTTGGGGGTDGIMS